MFDSELRERPARSPQLPKYNDLHCRANSLRGSIDEHKPSYAPVESARRVLVLLQALNAQRIATIGSLHQVTGLSKPTIVRMLETLISEGYVVRDNFVGGYSVTSKVVSLASGFSGAPLLIEAARSRAVALTNDIKWPVSLGTLRDGHILVSFTTAPISPWAYPFPVLHRFLDLELTAMGQCYLAFCDDEERALLSTRSPSSAGNRASRSMSPARCVTCGLPASAVMPASADPAAFSSSSRSRSSTSSAARPAWASVITARRFRATVFSKAWSSPCSKPHPPSRWTCAACTAPPTKAPPDYRYRPDAARSRTARLCHGDHAV